MSSLILTALQPSHFPLHETCKLQRVIDGALALDTTAFRHTEMRQTFGQPIPVTRNHIVLVAAHDRKLWLYSPDPGGRE
jgi:hypothetical protein